MRGNLDISTDAPSTATFEDHSARHENGGADEISVEGLSGLLADAQTPLAHATSHQNNGTDEIDVTGLSGLLADPQTPIPAGNDTEVQFKDGTTQAGDSGLTYNKTTDKLTVGGGLTADGTTFNVDATNDRVGVGTASPEERLHVVGNGTDSTVVRTENSGVPNGVAFDQYSNSGTQTNSFFGRKLRGSKASPLRTKSGDALIRVGGSGGHAADDVSAATLLNAFRARIELLAAEDWTSTAQGTNITFSTTPTGSTTLTEAVRISGSGNLTVAADVIAARLLDAANQTYYIDPADGTLSVHVAGTLRGANAGAATPTFASKDDPNTGIYFDGADALLIATGGVERVRVGSSGLLTLAAGQIAFPATQNASADPNTIDDYEEGTWTPNVGGTATYSAQDGRYIKIGKLVIATFNFRLTSLGTGSTTTLSGLPFAAAGGIGNYGSGLGYFDQLAVNIYWGGFYTVGSTLLFTGQDALDGSVNPSIALFGDTSGVLGTVIYFAAN